MVVVCLGMMLMVLVVICIFDVCGVGKMFCKGIVGKVIEDRLNEVDGL